LRLEREACRAMLGFGGWLLVGTLLTYLATDAPTLSLGKAFTKEELAVFAVAFMLATFSSQCVSKLRFAGGVPGVSPR
jgi:O-antigen/teichoic acid export membrane protein